MADPLAFRMSMRSITVSTSGEAAQVRKLLQHLPTVQMAFSVHSADEETRSRLMPINRRVPLRAFAEAMRHYMEHTRRRVTVQCTSYCPM